MGFFQRYFDVQECYSSIVHYDFEWGAFVFLKKEHLVLVGVLFWRPLICFQVLIPRFSTPLVQTLLYCSGSQTLFHLRSWKKYASFFSVIQPIGSFEGVTDKNRASPIEPLLYCKINSSILLNHAFDHNTFTIQTHWTQILQYKDLNSLLWRAEDSFLQQRCQQSNFWSLYPKTDNDLTKMEQHCGCLMDKNKYI